MSRIAITVPPPDEIRQRIIDRRAEILELKRLLKMSQTAERAEELARQNAVQLSRAADASQQGGNDAN
jgi:hypothetical protein